MEQWRRPTRRHTRQWRRPPGPSLAASSPPAALAAGCGTAAACARRPIARLMPTVETSAFLLPGANTCMSKASGLPSLAGLFLSCSLQPRTVDPWASLALRITSTAASTAASSSLGLRTSTSFGSTSFLRVFFAAAFSSLAAACSARFASFCASRAASPTASSGAAAPSAASSPASSLGCAATVATAASSGCPDSSALGPPVEPAPLSSSSSSHSATCSSHSSSSSSSSSYFTLAMGMSFSPEYSPVTWPA
mmetsp:Transcript_24930/g.72961  ORF Transcript_24930/g.72961 Transcript_24930/m.72961 type:complete len:251 (-) Transcript_24930:1192-1944(-)